jgi:hypothetical protein
VPPKTPKQLREEIEAQQAEETAEGHERTAEGLETPTPSRDDFLANLGKVTKRDAE